MSKITTLAALKKASTATFERTSKQMEEMTKSAGPTADARFWEPTRDKNGNAYAVIRFLAAPMGEDSPVVRFYEHAFQGPGGWYIEKSLTSIGKDDPVSEYNVKLWNSGIPSNKAIVSGSTGKPGTKRKVSYVANILVIEDKANPDNEGKVFLYKFGAKIFEKIQRAMKPEFEDETPYDPYNFWTGANFKVKVRKVEGYPNYDACEFSPQGPIADSDDAIEAIWKQQYSLGEFTDPVHYKSYDELNARFKRVMQLDSESAGPSTSAVTQPSAKAKSDKTAVGQYDREFAIDSGDNDEEDAEAFFASIGDE